jgi:hypothetical protein
MEFETGQLITLADAGRRGALSMEKAPIFIILDIPSQSPYRNSTRIHAYCYYDPTNNGWLDQNFTITLERIIHFNP